MSSYSGAGYSGSIDNVGSLPDTIKIQDFLYNKGAVGSAYIEPLFSEYLRIAPLGSVTALPDFLRDVGFPATLEDLIVDFRVYVYALYAQNPGMGITASMTLEQKMAQAREWLQNNAPDELNYLVTPGAVVGNLYEVMANAYITDSGILSDNWLVRDPADGVLKPFASVSPTNQLALAGKYLEDNYAEFITRFNYTPLPTGTTTIEYPPGSNNSLPAVFDYLFKLQDGFKDFLQRVVEVGNPINDPSLKLSYENFYNAYLSSGSTFESFFDTFVQKYYGVPFVSTGSEGFFNPVLLFDKWTEEVLKNYQTLVPNSAALGPSGSDAGSAKTLVLNRIFSLLVLMIEALQKTAAAQSERLNLFSKWQKAYTDLQNGIRYFLKNASDIKDIGDDNRNNVNAFNTSLTEMIKARKSVLTDDAKNLQTQINQSNDTVNQQASMATSILQEMASILSALYR